ncbi:hypothetical protein ARMGADRAFT_926892 [Armillaria gallica]|uniref:Uncharacterized protein n=1 Tax=Armillaria gallica TaxID=47427 RepID=A0A2H3DHV2_ARMGA|nr:hypothetical protein ARMGADRAFT_926892 [Armillaria gallica]
MCIICKSLNVSSIWVCTHPSPSSHFMIFSDSSAVGAFASAGIGFFNVPSAYFNRARSCRIAVT